MMDIPQYDMPDILDDNVPGRTMNALDVEHFLGHDLKIRVSQEEFDAIVDEYLRLKDSNDDIPWTPWDGPDWQKCIYVAVDKVLGPNWQDYYGL